VEPTEPAPGPASAPAPKPARPARNMTISSIPAGIAALLHTLRILIGHGRHLCDIAPARVGKPDFNAVTSCIGTNRLFGVLAHLQRGLMRAIALERVLLERAASGRDVRVVGPGKRRYSDPYEPSDPAAVAETDPSADPQFDPSAEAETARRPARRPSRPRNSNDPEVYMPTMEEMEADARRRPIGRIIADICIDLAVAPRFCFGPFWNDVFELIRAYGGRIEDLMKERSNREFAFVKELDRIPGSNWEFETLNRDGFRRVLGFFIGEPRTPSDPSPEPGAPTTAMATGPP